MKILWGKSGGLCAFPDCCQKLISPNNGSENAYLIGEMAHIQGSKSGASRYNADMTMKERDDYENLILLCPTHHTIIDEPENEETYSVALLQKFKSDHESFVERVFLKQSFETDTQVAEFLLPIFAENLDALENFGPNSQIAKSRPHSDAHEIWLQERIVTILPNNKLILNTLLSNRHHFGGEFSALFARYRSHVASYESWVMGKHSYDGVIRFPAELPAKLKELKDARK